MGCFQKIAVAILTTLVGMVWYVIWGFAKLCLKIWEIPIFIVMTAATERFLVSLGDPFFQAALSIIGEPWRYSPLVGGAVCAGAASAFFRWGITSSDLSEKWSDLSGALGSQGSAAWRKNLSALDGGGYPLGRHPETGEIVSAPAGYDGHFLTYGATRSGKGVGVVIPALLSSEGSAVVIDPKSELLHITARQRRRKGSEPVALDPFDLLGQKESPFSALRKKVNPVDLIDIDSAAAVDDAKRLARAIVPARSEGGGGASEHFEDKARDTLKGLLLHVASLSDPNKRNLIHLRRVLSSGADGWDDLMAAMKNSPAVNGRVAEAAHRFESMDGKEASGVLSTMHRSTDFLDSPAMESHLTPSPGDGVDLRSLRARAQSLYLIVPPDMIADYRGYLRTIVGGVADGLRRASGTGRVLFMLDEVAQLGKMETLEKGVSVLAGYGANLWFIFQSRGQLVKLYGENEAISGNCNLVQFVGVAATDKVTAEAASDAAGKATVLTSSSGKTEGRGKGDLSLLGQNQRGERRGSSEAERALITPDEVQRLDGELLLFESTKQPARLEKLEYFRDPEFQGRFDPRPSL